MQRSSRLLSLTSATTVALVLSAAPAQAEFVISIYGGDVFTHDTDVDLTEPGTSLTFENVPFDGESFEKPPYYGYRVSYWLKSRPNLGGALDFTHAKTIADRAKPVTVTGTRGGAPVSTVEPAGNTFEELEFSHGHNLLTANGLYRWFPTGQRDDSLLGRLQPYAGAGAGVAIPHVEIITPTSRTKEYQIAGPAVQGLLGVNVDLHRYISTFTEYKLTYANINADLSGGGEVEVNPLTHHFIVGLSVRF